MSCRSDWDIELNNRQSSTMPKNVVKRVRFFFQKLIQVLALDLVCPRVLLTPLKTSSFQRG